MHIRPAHKQKNPIPNSITLKPENQKSCLHSIIFTINGGKEELKPGNMNSNVINQVASRTSFSSHD